MRQHGIALMTKQDGHFLIIDAHNHDTAPGIEHPRLHHPNTLLTFVSGLHAHGLGPLRQIAPEDQRTDGKRQNREKRTGCAYDGCQLHGLSLPVNRGA